MTILELLIETVCKFLTQLQSHCAPSNRQQFVSLVEQQVKQQLYGMLLQWLESNSSRTTRCEQAELQATVTSWAIYGAALRWSNGDRSETAAAFAHRALPVIAAGLAIPSKHTARSGATFHK